MNLNESKTLRGRLPNQCIDYLKNVEGLNRNELKAEFKSFFGRELSDNSIEKYCANRMSQEIATNFTKPKTNAKHVYVIGNDLVVDTKDHNQKVYVNLDMVTLDTVIELLKAKVDNIHNHVEALAEFTTTL